MALDNATSDAARCYAYKDAPRNSSQGHGGASAEQ
jgi:hypothetical protein